MDKPYRFLFPQIGGTPLLLTFIILCLSVLAFFVLLFSRDTGRISTDSAQSVSAYYSADAQAEGILARIRAGELPEGVEQNGDVYTFSCPVGTTQMLMVEVRSSGEEYTVFRWETITLEEWVAEQKETE